MLVGDRVLVRVGLRCAGVLVAKSLQDVIDAVKVMCVSRRRSHVLISGSLSDSGQSAVGEGLRG